MLPHRRAIDACFQKRMLLKRAHGIKFRIISTILGGGADGTQLMSSAHFYFFARAPRPPSGEPERLQAILLEELSARSASRRKKAIVCLGPPSLNSQVII